MDSIKYIGLDVHQSTISAAVLNADGKLVMQSVLATHATAILDLVQGLRGTLYVTFEEGTHSAWLYDLLVRRVAKLVVCNPRKNALLKAGNKSDTIDARKLAELLRAGLLSPVYHGQNSTAAVKHLGRSYAALTEDTTRIMGRLKALYRSQAIACAGKKPYGARHREAWLAQLPESGLQRRAQRLYQELDLLQAAATRSPSRSDCGVSQAQRNQVAAHHSLARPDTRCPADRAGADAASLPQQAAVLGLLRPGARDAQQRRLSDGERATGAPEKAGIHSRLEPEPQP